MEYISIPTVIFYFKISVIFPIDPVENLSKIFTIFVY